MSEPAIHPLAWAWLRAERAVLIAPRGKVTAVVLRAARQAKDAWIVDGLPLLAVDSGVSSPPGTRRKG